MSVVQINLSSDIGEIVEREVAAGHAPSAEAYIAQAVRAYACADDEVVAAAEAGIADIESGQCVEIRSERDLRAWGDAVMTRVRARLADPT